MWNNKPNLRRLVPKGIPYRSYVPFHSKWKYVNYVQIAAFKKKNNNNNNYCGYVADTTACGTVTLGPLMIFPNKQAENRNLDYSQHFTVILSNDILSSFLVMVILNKHTKTSEKHYYYHYYYCC